MPSRALCLTGGATTSPASASDDPRRIRDACSHLPGVLEELAARVAEISGPGGRSLKAQVYRPEMIYRRVRNFPPDLIVCFEDLAWRCNADLGSGMLHRTEAFWASDEANHSRQGIFMLYDPRSSRNLGELPGLHLFDVAPTVLSVLGLPVPDDMRGSARWG